jgi:hypothetical protein
VQSRIRLAAPFSWILVLLIRLTLPIGDTQGKKDVLYCITNDNLITVTNELMRSSAISNIGFQGAGKLLIRFDAIDISELGISSYKNNSSNGTIINSWDIGLEDVTSNRFIATRGVKDRIG